MAKPFGIGSEWYKTVADNGSGTTSACATGVSSMRVIPGNEHLFVTDAGVPSITAYRKSDLISGIVYPIPVLEVNINDYMKATITTID